MSVFERTSTSCDLSDMSPVLRDAITVWAADHDAAADLDRAVACCETVSLRRGAAAIYGRMASLPRDVRTGAVLTPERLLWATVADDREPEVTAVALPDVAVVDYRESPDYSRMVDSGLQLVGPSGNGGAEQSLFLGLGEDADGAAFLATVLGAWRALEG